MNREWKKILIGLIIIFLLISYYQSLDESILDSRPMVGKLKKMSGSVRFRNESIFVWKNVNIKNQNFFDRDIIETGPESEIEIELLNNKKIIISENSQVILSVEKKSTTSMLNLVLKNGFINTKDNISNSHDKLNIKVGDKTFSLNETSAISIKKNGEDVDLQVKKGNIEVLDTSSKESKILRKGSLSDEEIKNLFLHQKKSNNFLFKNIQNNNFVWIFSNQATVPINFSFSKDFDSKFYQVVMKLDGEKSFLFVPNKIGKDFTAYVNFSQFRMWAKYRNIDGLSIMTWNAQFGLKNIKTEQTIWNHESIKWNIVFWSDIPENGIFFLKTKFFENGKDNFFKPTYRIAQSYFGSDGIFVNGKENLSKIMNYVSTGKGFNLSKIKDFPEQESFIVADNNQINYLVPSKFNIYSQKRLFEILNPGIGYVGYYNDFIPKNNLLSMSKDIVSFLSINPFLFIFDKSLKKINSHLVIQNIEGRNLILKKSQGIFKKNVPIYFQ